MSWPPSYPRVPHLPPAPTATRDDLVLDATATAALLNGPVVVEEKLDGANAMLWLADGQVRAATRGGPDARDRGGQLGPLRAWAAQHAEGLRDVLSIESVVYAEWMWLRHSVPYDTLPDHLVAFDLFSSGGGFASVAERDRAFARAGLLTPPSVFSGVLGARERLDALLSTSRYGVGPAEGLIVRSAGPERGAPRLAKIVSREFEPRPDSSWRERSERNVVA